MRSHQMQREIWLNRARLSLRAPPPKLVVSVQADKLMPAIARPQLTQPGRCIMVESERRGRAARLAGMNLLMYVRQLSGEQHQSVQRAENIQRESLTQA